jgi:hypothetical protein
MTIIYEKRTYDVKVGEMQQVKQLYSTLGWPALSAGGFDNKLIGYFVSDTGDLHQLIHLWRFDNDADRRDFWARLFVNESFIASCSERSVDAGSALGASSLIQAINNESND